MYYISAYHLIPHTTLSPIAISHLVRASTSNNKMFAVAKMLKFLQNCEFNPNQP